MAAETIYDLIAEFRIHLRKRQARDRRELHERSLAGSRVPSASSLNDTFNHPPATAIVQAPSNLGSPDSVVPISSGQLASNRDQQDNATTWKSQIDAVKSIVRSNAPDSGKTFLAVRSHLEKGFNGTRMQKSDLLKMARALFEAETGGNLRQPLPFDYTNA